MVIGLRDLTPDDIPAWHRLRAEIEAEARTGEHGSVEEDAEEFADIGAGGRGAVVGAFDGAEPVAYFSASAPEATGSVHPVELDGGVRPIRHGQGIGSLLVPAMLRRGREMRSARAPHLPVRFGITRDRDDMAQAALLAEHGFLPHHWSVLMRHALTGSPETPPLPEDFALTRTDPAGDAARLLAAYSEVALGQHRARRWLSRRPILQGCRFFTISCRLGIRRTMPADHSFDRAGPARTTEPVTEYGKDDT